MIASLVVTAAEQAEEHHTQLPMSATAYALLVFGVAVLLLLLTAAFRNVSHRH
jgi:TRAP-type C4-dicarboxylate transport system permease small subunit